MRLDAALGDVQTTVPECVAVGLVDMRTGMLLSVKTVDSHPQEVLDLVAAATRDLFLGANVTAIERMFKRARGVRDDGRHYFGEFIVLSENLVHLFQRCTTSSDFVLITVCRITANLGMVLAKARGALAAVEAAL